MRVVFFLMVLALAACSKDPESSPNGDGCPTAAAAAGKAVYYSGNSNDKFKYDQQYVGKIVSVLADDYVEVDWTSFKSVEYKGSVKYEATCTPNPVGKRAYYSGNSTTRFKYNVQYTGTVVHAFNDGYYQVSWDTGEVFSSVEYKGSLKIEK